MAAQVTPIDGWGYHETIDGELAATFGIEIIEDGVEFAPGIKGWTANVLEGKIRRRHC